MFLSSEVKRYRRVAANVDAIMSAANDSRATASGSARADRCVRSRDAERIHVGVVSMRRAYGFALSDVSFQSR
jgi:hypothetical protein